MIDNGNSTADSSRSGLSFRGSVRRGKSVAVRDVDLQLPQGSCLGIIGPNGSGKSTLLLGLRGQLPVDGTLTLDGDDVTRLPRPQIARRIAVVPQRTEFTFPFTVEEVVLLGRAPHRRPWQPYASMDRQIVSATLERLGLSPLRADRVDAISGGERRKVFLARALVQETPYLFLDEPVLGLDPPFQQELFRIIEELRRERGRSIIIVLHDLRSAARLCDRFVGLRAGQQCLCGAREDVLTEQALEDLYGIRWSFYHDSHGHTVPLPAAEGND